MKNHINNKLIKELKVKYEKYLDEVMIPPPSFIEMDGNVVYYDVEKEMIEINYPVKYAYMNPFGAMQGGMIAAAIDNTLGPLSMLVAKLNYTRTLEIKYRKPIRNDIKKIKISAKLIKRDKRRLHFMAIVLDMNNNELAIAKAVHWVVI